MSSLLVMTAMTGPLMSLQGFLFDGMEELTSQDCMT